MKRKWNVLALLGIFLLAVVGAAHGAQWANPQLLVDVETLKTNLNKPDWVVVDCRDLKKYLVGHIPGAISFGNRVKKALRDPSARVYQDVTKYEKLFGIAGIGNDTHVVFYYDDLDTLPDAAVGFWIMEYLGHDKVHVLDGGLDAWRNGGNRLDNTPVRKEPRTFKAHVVPSRLATTAEILKIAQGQGNGRQLIDSRTEKEHEGKDIRTILGGHVPNTAINVSHLETLEKVNDPKTGKKKSVPYFTPTTVAKLFGGLDPAKRTIGYCQTGTRSTLTYLQLRLLGFKDPANWDDSWRVYASDLHAANPIDAPNGVQFYNFDKVNKSLKKLEKKVTQLEEQLKKLTGGK